MKKITQKIDPG